MSNQPHPLKCALQIMEGWPNLPDRDYKATVYMFAESIPSEDVLEAAEIARDKIPQGGMDAFKYFCGVCHNKIREAEIRHAWN